MESLAHTPFIAAAYGIALCVLAGLGVFTWMRGRSVDARLEALEAARPNRRAQRRQRQHEA